MGIETYVVDTVEVVLGEEFKNEKREPDTSSLSPVPCLSIAGKRTVQDFQIANAKAEKAGILQRQAGPLVDEFFKNDPLPLQAQRVREKLREIDGRNTFAQRRSAGVSSHRETRSEDFKLAEKHEHTAALLSQERYLTPALEKRYGKHAGKGSLLHPHMYDRAFPAEGSGGQVPRADGATRGLRGLQAEVQNLARLHAAEIERERKEAEKTLDMEEAMIRRSLHHEEAQSKLKELKGSACFRAIPRERALLGARMAPPTLNFGPGHYSITYGAQDRHTLQKDMKSTYASAGRIFLEAAGTDRAEGARAPEAAGASPGTGGRDGDKPRGPKPGGKKKGKKKDKDEDQAPPLTSSFRNTGFGSPPVGREKARNAGAHLGPTKYDADYSCVWPSAKLIPDFGRQPERPPVPGRGGLSPGPGAYEVPPPGYGCGLKCARSRDFSKQTGRPDYAAAHDTRPATAPVVLHTSTPLPFAPPAVHEPYAPAQAMQAAGTGTARAGSPTHHQEILRQWEHGHPVGSLNGPPLPTGPSPGARPGSVPGSFGDAGMNMWFDEFGDPLTSAVIVGWGAENSDRAGIAWGRQRFGGLATPHEVDPTPWETGGLKRGPKLVTIPRCSRTEELKGMRTLLSTKSGCPSSAPRCHASDTPLTCLCELNPSYSLTERRSPAWSLPKNRTEKPKTWKPPGWLIRQSMQA
uniref:Uncharacterized protein n=1 Tax=Tetraselmis sp. GSL018 TaxID=582737 RepID=A0A061S2K9_9CHLO